MASYKLTEGRAVHDWVDEEGRTVDRQYLPGEVIETDQDLTLLNTPGRPPRYIKVGEEGGEVPLTEEQLKAIEAEEARRRAAHPRDHAVHSDPVHHAPPAIHPTPSHLHKTGHIVPTPPKHKKN